MSSLKNKETVDNLVSSANAKKKLFTAGPASLLPENLTGIIPCFGRGDVEYLKLEDNVLTSLKLMSGHTKIARMQGSGSLALEIVATNFLCGNVLIISSGYYSERLEYLANSVCKNFGTIKNIDIMTFEEAKAAKIKYDWIWACSTETSVGMKTSIKDLKTLAKLSEASIALDATASFGLEEDHELADVISYSSCKGLFGLTGACFVAFNNTPKSDVQSFYLNLENHVNKKMTGPYHAIASLSDVLPIHETLKKTVQINKLKFMKTMSAFLTQPPERQPLLCTHVSVSIKAKSDDVVLYQPRNNLGGSIVCHIGEVHTKENCKANILDSLEVG